MQINKQGMNIEDIVNHGLTYSEYRQHIGSLLAEGKTTGKMQTSKLVDFTRLNVQRMNRLDKTITIPAGAAARLKGITGPVVWLVVGDAWCGDCAQTIPVINKMAEVNKDKTALRIVSRDSYPELTEYYHAASIPKLLFINRQFMQVTGMWGPRPQPAQNIMLKWKESKGKIAWEDFEKELHLWYSKDRGLTTINELVNLITEPVPDFQHSK